MTNKTSFSPIALMEARIARGFNRAQLANEIGITRQAVSLIEKGENEPKHDTLSKIADVLRLPLKYFYRSPINDFDWNSPIFYRKLSSTTDLAHAKAIIKAKWHYNAHLFLTKFLKRITPNLPKFSFTKEYDFANLSNDGIEEYSKELRRFWGLGLGPIVGLTPLIEKNGGIVFQIDFEDEISGFSFYANGNIPFIVCAKNAPAARNRFNLAHEIGHLIFHAITDENDLAKNHKQLEEQAHYFATAFLFPKEKFFDEFFSADLNYLVKLKERWGVSVGAIIQRATNLGILTADEVANFYKRNPGIRRKEPGDDTMEVERPTFPHNGLKAILDANLITVDDIKSELPYGDEDLAEMFYVEKNYFQEKDAEANNIANVFEFRQKP